MSRLRALNVFAEFRVWKSQIRECHVHEIAQTSHDDSIAEIKCAIWWRIFVCAKYFCVMSLRQGSGAGDQVTLNYDVIIII